GVHRGINLANKAHQYLQQNIHTSQMNLLATIEKVILREIAKEIICNFNNHSRQDATLNE
ncbi:unnamed protein product, partial [Rotaria magnacalcarata]